MMLEALATDNITELLLKIIEFTEARQKILTQNINSSRQPDYAPKDLPVDEFSSRMDLALSEHAVRRRLLLRDGRNIKFGANGSFTATPVIDKQARRLLEKDRNVYLRGQITKLMENTLNRKIALGLLKQKQSEDPCGGRRLY